MLSISLRPQSSDNQLTVLVWQYMASRATNIMQMQHTSLQDSSPLICRHISKVVLQHATEEDDRFAAMVLHSHKDLDWHKRTNQTT